MASARRQRCVKWAPIRATPARATLCWNTRLRRRRPLPSPLRKPLPVGSACGNHCRVACRRCSGRSRSTSCRTSCRRRFTSCFSFCRCWWRLGGSGSSRC
uniref:(northern house mosquito) hypothetical protein n=1 Tax=Culex pipiens TaxID=7175 RepID=A0A8D8G475_CULPI